MATHPPDLAPTAARILDAARELFFTEGFDAVTTDRLCRAASVSKSSLYKHFGDMAGLLAALARREGDVFAVGVDAQPKSPQALRQALVAYGTNLLTLLNQPFCVRFDRVMHEQARKQPAVAEQFYRAAYGRSHAEVAALLAFAQGRGLIAADADPPALADNLLSMWAGLSMVRTRLGLQEQPTTAPAAWAAHCVGVLLGPARRAGPRRQA
jgi:TetR/AcrR family transcriptional repressor of mexJK operon